MIVMTEAGYANTLAAPLRELPLSGVIRVEKAWNHSEGGDKIEYSLESTPWEKFIAELQRPIRVRTNFVVDTVVWSGENKLNGEYPEYNLNLIQKNLDNVKNPPSEIISESGDKVLARHVVMAVPITVLQDGDITFKPPLPDWKVEAANVVKMNPSCKMVGIFKKQFWPDNLRSVICADKPIPEMWPGLLPNFRSNGVRRNRCSGFEDDHAFFVGFCTADYADYFNNLSRSKIATEFCAQLDEMFATEDDPKPASSNFVDLCVCRWSRKRHIRGGYSCPSRKPAHFKEHHLVLLRRSLNKNLYFAGEAVMDGHSTMDAAADAGVEAAREILRNMVPAVAKL